MNHPSHRVLARFSALVACVSAALPGLSGCAQKTSATGEPDPELASYVRLMMPRKIEIQHYLTKPVSFARDGNADGLEVIIAARDSFGDPTKIVGTFHFELNERRLASADRVGQRLAFWPVQIDSDTAILKYWDRLSRFYRFPLKLETTALKPGDYILSARLLSPGADTLFDEYEFTHTAQPVSGATISD